MMFALVNEQSLRQLVQVVADELEYIVRWDLPLQGVIATVADTRPAVLVVDVVDETTDWPQIVWALKTNPATRRLGIIGIANALTPELQQRANHLLINEVLDAGKLMENTLHQTLTDRIRTYARQTDTELQTSIATAIAQPLPPLVVQGLNEFNAQSYFEAHETLEHAWIEEKGPIRDLYRGILQIAVAYYHILRGNHRGAMKMFLRAVQWLEPLPPMCQGINVGKLREDARRARQHLEELGPHRIDDYDKSLLQPIEFELTHE